MDPIIAHLVSYIQEYTYLGVYVALAMTGFAVPVPQNITLIVCGFIAERGYANLYVMIVVCCLGLMTADNLLFTWGKRYVPAAHGFSLVRRFLTPERKLTFQRLFHKFHSKIIVITRLTPGIRMLVFLSAGAMGMRRLKFIMLDSLGCIINVPILVSLGYIFSYNLEGLREHVTRVEFLAVSLILIIGLGYLVWTQWLLVWTAGLKNNNSKENN